MQNRYISLILASAAASFIFTGTANGDAPGRVTFGDVNSFFNSFGPAFNLLSADHPANPSVSVAAPADGLTRGRISPIPQINNPTHCENDWAVINLFIFNFKSVSGRKEAAEEIANFEVDYELDGSSVDSQRTPLRGAMRGPKSNKDRVWFVSDGFFVEPGSLAVGFHMVQANLTVDGNSTLLPPVVFEILPSGHPDCS